MDDRREALCRGWRGGRRWTRLRRALHRRAGQGRRETGIVGGARSDDRARNGVRNRLDGRDQRRGHGIDRAPRREPGRDHRSGSRRP